MQPPHLRPQHHRPAPAQHAPAVSRHCTAPRCCSPRRNSSAGGPRRCRLHSCSCILLRLQTATPILLHDWLMAELILLRTCSTVSAFASSSTLTSGLAAVSPRCQGCRSHPSVFAPERISVTALSKCCPCAGWHGTGMYVDQGSHLIGHHMRGKDLAVAHRVVLHVIEAPLPVQFDCDSGAHWKRCCCCVQDSTVGVPLHILYAGCGAILRHEHAAVGRLTAACTT